jgi:predicted DNA-binding protein (UPF0251 family)
VNGLCVKPEVGDFGDDRDSAVAKVLASICGRNLTHSQRAMIGARLTNAQKGGQSKTNASIEAFVLSESTLVTQDAAADRVGASRSSVQRAVKVAESPVLAKKP